MNTIIVMLGVTLTALWALKRNVVKGPVAVSANHPTISSAGWLDGRNPLDKWLLPTLSQSPGNSIPPASQFESGRAESGERMSATDECHSPIRKRFIELKSEATAIVQRYRDHQAQLNDQLSRELASIGEHNSISNHVCKTTGKRVLELKGEAATIIQRYYDHQTQLNERLAKELASIREQLEHLQQEANKTLAIINPGVPANTFRPARRDQ